MIGVPTSFTDDDNQRRSLDWFERLGEDKVQLYVRLDGQRFFGDWPTRQLAEQWLADKQRQRRQHQRRAQARRALVATVLTVLSLATVAGALAWFHDPLILLAQHTLAALRAPTGP